MRAMGKHYLQEGAWLTEPLNNSDNDFVTPLVNQYLHDLETR